MLFALMPRHAEVFSMKSENLTRCQTAVEVVHLRNDANMSFNGNRLVGNVDTLNSRDTVCWSNPRCQDSDRRGFAGAVWSQQPEEFAGGHFESDPIQRFYFGPLTCFGRVGLAQLGDSDCCFHDVNLERRVSAQHPAAVRS